MMHRFFTSSEKFIDGSVEITGSELHHLRKVLRLSVGNTVEVLDGEGKCCRVELTEVSGDKALGKILSQAGEGTESSVFITMGLSLLKGKAMDGAIRKAVELGVSRIVPLRGVHCVSRLSDNEVPDRVERWSGIVRDAVKQCGRVKVPEVTMPETVQSFCKRVGDDSLKLLFWEAEAETGLSEINEKKPPGTISFLVGPEGGFSLEEVNQARASGFVAVSLGARILRAETMPLVALTLLQYRWGDLASRKT